MQRLAAVLVLLSLVAGVCPPAARAAAGGHACCDRDERCPSVTAAMTCCAPQPVESPATQPKSMPSKVSVPDAAATPALTVPSALAAEGVAPRNTLGIPPLSPLLRSCLRRI
jgi:hypothetical protein